MFKYAIFAALAALTTLTLATPILARDRPPEARVAFGNLDLATAQGVKVLDKRISWAIATLCPDQPDVRQIHARRQVELCRASAAAQVAPQRARAIANARDHAGMAALAR